MIDCFKTKPKAQELHHKIQSIERQKLLSFYGKVPKSGGKKRTLDNVIHTSDKLKEKYQVLIKDCPCEGCIEERLFNKPLKVLSNWELMIQWVNMQRHGMVTIDIWKIAHFKQEMKDKYELKVIKENKFRVVYRFRPIRKRN